MDTTTIATNHSAIEIGIFAGSTVCPTPEQVARYTKTTIPHPIESSGALRLKAPITGSGKGEMGNQFFINETTGNDLTTIKAILYQAGYSWQEEVSQDSLSLTLTRSARSEDDVMIYLTVPMNDRSVGYALEEMAHLVTAVFPWVQLK